MTPSPVARCPLAVAVVLASASPRRHELLGALGVPFEVRVAEVPEPLVEGVPAAVQAERLALAKARAVAAAWREAAPWQRPRGSRVPAVVLGADTIVVLDGKPLGKPENAEAARRMLRALRGRPHEVVTAVAAVLTDHPRCDTDHAATAVHMRPYTDAEIESYIAGGDPFDKAGAYAIQHPGFRPVDRIEGCYCNVMGLPLWTVRRLLSRTAPALATSPPDHALDRCRACPCRTNGGD